MSIMPSDSDNRLDLPAGCELRIHRFRPHPRGPVILTPADMAIDPGQSSVYRLLNWSNLLYIGATRFPWRRLQQHGYDKPWWWEVTTVQQIVTSTHGLALQLEDESIHADLPLYNRTGPWSVRRKAAQRRGLDAALAEVAASLTMPA